MAMGGYSGRVMNQAVASPTGAVGKASLVGMLEELSKRVGELDEEINALFNQLRPLLDTGAEPPGVEVATPPHRMASEMTQAVSEIMDRVETCGRKLVVLRSTLQV
jgi:hypothetical protein